MAKDDIDIRWLSSDEEVLNTFAKFQKRAESLTETLKKSGQAGQQAGQKTKSSFSSAVGTVEKFTGAIVGVGGVVKGIQVLIGVLQREIQDLRQRQSNAAAKQLEFAPALTQAFRISGGLLGGGQEFEKRLKDFTRTIPTADPTEVANAVGATLSSIGPTNKQEAQLGLRAVKAAFTYAPTQDAETKTELSAVGGKIAKKMGITPEQALGLIQQTGNLANVRDIKPLAQNLGPAMLNLQDSRFTATQSGSLLAAVTQGIGDTEGSTTRTATANLATSLDKFQRMLGFQESPHETIQRLQKDPKLRRLFLEGGKTRGFSLQTGKRGMVNVPEAQLGKGIAETTIRSLLGEGDAAVAKQYDAGIKLVGTKADWQRQYDDNVRGIRQLPVVKNALMKRGWDAGKSSAQIADIAGGESAITREGIENILQSHNVGPHSRMAIMAKLEWDARGRLKTDQAIKYFRRHATDPKQETAMRAEIQKMPTLMRGPYEEALNAGLAKNDIANRLESINRTMQEQNRLVGEQNKMMNKPDNAPPAPVNAKALGRNN